MDNKQALPLMLILLLFTIFGCRSQGDRENDLNTTGTSSSSSEESPAAHLDRYTIVQANHPNARCNDGTTPVFYHRPGVGDGTDKWIIWFKGGGTGWSAESFRNRGATITSAKPWMSEEYAQLGSTGNEGSPDGEAGGILSSDPAENPDFYNWNHVYLVYCSSDGWTGTRLPSPESGNRYFAGHYILNAMFDALNDPQIIGTQNLSEATNVLLTGSSAGALGLRSNVDRLAATMPEVDVRAISDAGVFTFNNPDMEKVFQEITSVQVEVWQSVLDEDCVQDYPDEIWRCLSGGFLVENSYIQTPMFIHQDQSDIKLQGALADSNLDVGEGLRLIGEGTRPLLETQSGVYSPNAGRHIIINNVRFNNFRLERHTFAEIFGNWYFNRNETTVLIEYP